MSRKKFKFLASFMIVTLIALVFTIAFGVKSYLDFKAEQNKIVLADGSEPQNKGIIKENPIAQNKNALLNSEDAIEKIEPPADDMRIGLENNIKLEEKSQESEQKQPDPITMLFTGDVLLSNSPLNAYRSKKNSIDGILSKGLLKTLSEADITMINQEFPFSSRGEQMADKQYTFKADPKYVSLFHDFGVDIVSLANNHTLDFGITALLDTIETLDKAKIRHVGAGAEINSAKKTEYITVKDRTIAFLGASRVIPVYDWNAAKDKAGLFTTYDPAMLLKEIKTAKEKSDLVVVYVHWGVERKEKPEEYQRALGKQYIDAGADIVIGAHPHVLQGIEYYNGKPIVYSLGNFIFGGNSYNTMLLKAEITKDDKISISVIPCQSANAFTSEITDKNQRKLFLNHIEQISYDISIQSEGKVEEK